MSKNSVMVSSFKFLSVTRSTVIFIACATVYLTAHAQSINDRVLSRVRVSETQNCAVATVFFNFPVQVTSVFPENEGDHVRISLRAIEIGRIDSGALRSFEELRPPNSKIADIQEIQYEGDFSTGPVLNISFKNDKYYSVKPGSDFRSLDIQIADNPVATACFGTSSTGAKTPPVKGLRGGRLNSDIFTIPDAVNVNAVYALNLDSSQKTFKKTDIIKAPILSDYATYMTSYEKDGVTWKRLRLGFFSTKTEADNIKNRLKSYYPNAWIVRTNATEREAVYQAWLIARKKKKMRTGSTGQSQNIQANPDVEKLINDAKTLMKQKNYRRAIQLLTKAISQKENLSSPKAHELLGLAREKNGQLAHAKAEYEDYLRRYPDNPGRSRVQQRLSTLLTTGKKAPDQLRNAKRDKSRYVKRLNASFSQFYQRDASIVTLEQPDIIPDPDKQVNQNALVSGADITASVSNDRFDASMRLSGSQIHDFMKTGRGNFGTLSAAYVELADNTTHLSARLGRQTRNTGGILGRFDGGLVRFDATENITVNIAGGAPVLRSRDLFVDRNRRFLGASIDFTDILEHVDANVYFIHQKVNDLVDRQAVGFELRYVDAYKNAYALVDYDTFYGSLNLALFNGSFRLKDNTTFNLSFDHRNTPSLATINAIQGQGVEHISQLRNLYTDSELYAFAQARTAKATTGALTISHPFSDKYSINTSVTLANIGSTQSAGSIPGQPGTGTDAFYSVQLLGNSIFKPGDLATIGFRYDDISTSRRYIFDLNTRYPFSRKFRVSPRLRLAKRNSLVADQNQFTVKPSLRINFIPNRLFQIELEGGAEWTRTNRPTGSETLKGYNLNLGYRLDF